MSENEHARNFSILRISPVINTSVANNKKEISLTHYSLNVAGYFRQCWLFQHQVL